MTLIDAIGRVAAGERIALVLFALGSLLARKHHAVEIAEAERPAIALAVGRLTVLAWTLMAWSVLSFSPLHTFWLIGRPAPHLLTRMGDVVASGLACAAFIAQLAARARAAGVSQQRVRRGAGANLLVVLAMVGVAWLSR
jgi:hypothetical protein